MRFVQNNRAFVLVSGSRDNSNDNNDAGVLKSGSTMSGRVRERVGFRVGAARRSGLTCGTKDLEMKMLMAGRKRKRSREGGSFGAKGKDEDLPSVRMHSLQDRDCK